MTDGTIRQRCRKFGQQYANTLRRRRSRPGDTWHLDEAFAQINGQQYSLWRAVDRDGQVLDILVPPRRDEAAATTSLRKLLEGRAYVPRAVPPSVEHRRHKGLNNRAEHAHQPTRERERRMRRCKDPGHA